jgi:putative tryptophan/tyrosine transport system substrate-binding protein
MCDWPDWAKKGCLLGYEPNPADLRRRTTDFVARILRGTPAGELPTEDPTTVELVINLRTARALGIDLSFCLLAQANSGIE